MAPAHRLYLRRCIYIWFNISWYDNDVFYICLIFTSQIVVLFLSSTYVLSFSVDVVQTLFIWIYGEKSNKNLWLSSIMIPITMATPITIVMIIIMITIRIIIVIYIIIIVIISIIVNIICIIITTFIFSISYWYIGSLVCYLCTKWFQTFGVCCKWSYAQKGTGNLKSFLILISINH